MCGRKRHILLDKLGLILAAVVHAADIQDRDGAKLVLEGLRDRFSRLRLIWADGGNAGKLVEWARDFRKVNRLRAEIVKRTDDMAGLKVLPHRWVVERTFSWLGRNRRLSKDYENLPETGEAMIHLMVRPLTKKLASWTRSQTSRTESGWPASRPAVAVDRAAWAHQWSARSASQVAASWQAARARPIALASG